MCVCVFERLCVISKATTGTCDRARVPSPNACSYAAKAIVVSKLHPVARQRLSGIALLISCCFMILIVHTRQQFRLLTKCEMNGGSILSCV